MVLLQLPAMVVTHTFLRAVLVVSLSLLGAQAGPTNPYVSIPLERMRGVIDHSSKPFLPSAVVHQQLTNQGIQRLAHMKGETRLSDHDLWSKISSRLSSLPKDLEFIRAWEAATSSFSKHHLGKRMSHSTHHNQHFIRGIDKANQTAPMQLRQSNNVGLGIQSQDFGYIAKLAIGTPPRNFSLLMDSGSADFWVGGEDCQGNGGHSCGQHTYLGSNSSSTFRDLREAWAIEYNTGEVSGTMVQDDISIANLHLKGFKFGVASKESPEFTGDDILFDGLAGLAKSMISKQRTATLVESLRKSGALKSSIISLKIPRLADNKHDGEMTFGGMNPARYDSRFVVTVKNQNKLGFWETPINRVKINGKFTGWTNRTGVLDTGTALLIAPQEDVDAIHSQVPGAKQVGGSWTVPCQTRVSISLTIGSIDFAIDPRDIAIIPVDSNDMQGDCWSGIGLGTVGPFHLPTTWLLGDVFLKNVYHSMNADEGNGEISFAKLK